MISLGNRQKIMRCTRSVIGKWSNVRKLVGKSFKIVLILAWMRWQFVEWTRRPSRSEATCMKSSRLGTFGRNS